MNLSDIRHLLNYTEWANGLALEAAAQLSDEDLRRDFQISHGRAVSIDIATSTALAFELGMISEADRDRILRLLLCAGLPIFTPSLTVAAELMNPGVAVDAASGRYK